MSDQQLQAASPGTTAQTEQKPNEPQAQPQQKELDLGSTTQDKPLSTTDILRKSSNAPKETPAQDVAIPDKLYTEADLATIKDPVARQMTKDILDKKEKDMLRGMNAKFQEIADIRKQLSAQQETGNTWTPDKLQQAMKDPTFVEAVQAEAQRQQQNAVPARS